MMLTQREIRRKYLKRYLLVRVLKVKKERKEEEEEEEEKKKKKKRRET